MNYIIINYIFDNSIIEFYAILQKQFLNEKKGLEGIPI